MPRVARVLRFEQLVGCGNATRRLPTLTRHTLGVILRTPGRE